MNRYPTFNYVLARALLIGGVLLLALVVASVLCGCADTSPAPLLTPLQ